jgi:hypothetical protein
VGPFPFRFVGSPVFSTAPVDDGSLRVEVRDSAAESGLNEIFFRIERKGDAHEMRVRKAILQLNAAIRDW